MTPEHCAERVGWSETCRGRGDFRGRVYSLIFPRVARDFQAATPAPNRTKHIAKLGRLEGGGAIALLPLRFCVPRQLLFASLHNLLSTVDILYSKTLTLPHHVYLSHDLR